MHGVILNKIKTCFHTVLIALLFSFPALSGKFSPLHAEEAHVENFSSEAELLSEVSHLAPGEKTLRVGVRITTSRGNHIYWKNPGDMGSPLSISWKLPEGFKVLEEHWPAPKVFEDNGMTFFGYEDSVLIVADVSVPEYLSVDEEIVLGAQVEWLACGRESCLPGFAELNLILPYKQGGAEVFPERSREFTETLFLQPRLIENREAVRVARGKGNEIIVNLSEKLKEPTDRVWFISETEDLAFSLAKRMDSPKGGFAWKLASFPKLREIRGVLLFADSSGAPVESLEIRSEILTDEEGTSLWQFAALLAMALLGGVLLNVMPCVLPLVTLKVYGLIKSAGEQKSSVIAHGLWFTFGVVGCFWGLAGVAFLLKFLGHNIGWGFQLQEPMFVATLILIFFLFSLSSLGLFEVGTMFSNLGGKLHSSGMRSSSGSSASFFNGVLATLVTTPCTGPFLGSILGLVMSLSFLEQLLVFSSIGLGMAAPYLFFSIFPKMLSLLPKPGSWMHTFKQVTGFMLLGTVMWLLWIFGAETSTNAVVLLLVGLWLAGIGAWMFGQWGTPVSPRKQRTVISLVFLSSILGALTLSFAATRFSSSSTVVSEGWEKFSSQRLEELRSQGRAIFVNFTAKWCVTCQMNKPLLHSAGVRKMFEEQGVILLEADWTRKDPGITEELARLGRASVPSYVFYPKYGDPVVLPEKLSVQVLEEAVAGALLP